MIEPALRVLLAFWLVVLAAAILLLMSACSPRVPAVEPVDSTPLPWCMRVMVKSKGEHVLLAACSATREQCEFLREMARRDGGLVGLEAVGSCQW